MNWNTGVPGRPPAGGAVVPRLPVLVLDDDHRVADLDLGVRDAAVRAGEAHPLARAEHLGVEVQSLRGTLHDQAGRDPAIAVRNRVGFIWKTNRRRMTMEKPLRLVPTAALTDIDKVRLLRLDEELACDSGELAWREWVDSALRTGKFFGSQSPSGGRADRGRGEQSGAWSTPPGTGSWPSPGGE